MRKVFSSFFMLFVFASIFAVACSVPAKKQIQDPEDAMRPAITIPAFHQVPAKVNKENVNAKQYNWKN